MDSSQTAAATAKFWVILPGRRATLPYQGLRGPALAAPALF